VYRLVHDEEYKHSYHIICTNVVFESNTGSMKAFIKDFLKIHEGDGALQALDDDGNVLKQCIVDPGVYDKKRCFRTVHSCKLTDKTTTTLQRVRFDKDGTWHVMTDLTEQDYLNTFVTHIDDSFDRSKIIKDPPSKPPSGGGKSLRVGEGSKASSSSDTRRQPTEEDDILIPHLQALVNAKGGEGCDVTQFLSIKEGVRTFQCKTRGERTCLVTPGVVHNSNNCFVKVFPDGIVRYGCLHPDCKGVVVIGKVPAPMGVDDMLRIEQEMDEESRDGGDS
jgi:hypothetical protein